MNEPAGLVVNGWSLFAHPLFLDQVETLIERVEHLRSKNPTGFGKKNAAKRLAAIYKLAFEIIPQDPASTEYLLGRTQGDAHKHDWDELVMQARRETKGLRNAAKKADAG